MWNRMDDGKTEGIQQDTGESAEPMPKTESRQVNPRRRYHYTRSCQITKQVFLTGSWRETFRPPAPSRNRRPKMSARRLGRSMKSTIERRSRPPQDQRQHQDTHEPGERRHIFIARPCVIRRWKMEEADPPPYSYPAPRRVNQIMTEKMRRLYVKKLRAYGHVCMIVAAGEHSQE